MLTPSRGGLSAMTPSEQTPLPGAPPLRSKNPIFAWSGTLFPPIDDRRPLFGKDEDWSADSGNGSVSAGLTDGPGRPRAAFGRRETRNGAARILHRGRDDAAMESAAPADAREEAGRGHPFRRVRQAGAGDNMLQINNSLRALAEAKHSLNQIMESAMDLPAVSRVNNEGNIGGSARLAAGIEEIKRNGANKERFDGEERRGTSQRCGMASAD